MNHSYETARELHVLILGILLYKFHGYNYFMTQEILPPPNLRNAPTCDTENLNKVPLSSRCLLTFDGRGTVCIIDSLSEGVVTPPLGV